MNRHAAESGEMAAQAVPEFDLRRSVNAKRRQRHTMCTNEAEACKKMEGSTIDSTSRNLDH
jgi:hypothetical protein